MPLYWFIYCQNDLLLTTEGLLPLCSEMPVSPSEGRYSHKLPALGAYECRALEVEEPVVKEGFRMVGLRESFDLLPAEHYAMAGKAREILYWDATTRFCGTCGTPLQHHTDISKLCPNCGREVWPSLATAIIVAVTRGKDEILLVQAKNFRGNYHGLVAGFVETGESLEECVHREVLEETGLRLKNLRYFASQPWPYPSGLMVGFKAEYAGGELSLQRSELSRGGWYNRHNLPPIPGRVSVARRLIDSWLEEGENITEN